MADAGKIIEIEVLRYRPEQDQEPVLQPLVALNLLAVHDAGQTGGQDPLILLADEMARSLAGKTPLRAAARLLEAWLVSARKEHLRRRLTALGINIKFGDELPTPTRAKGGAARG